MDIFRNMLARIALATCGSNDMKINGTTRLSSARRQTTQRGNALVEGALTISAFLMIFLGIIDFSRMSYAYNSVQYLSREATRFASVRGNSSGRPTTSAAVSTFVTGRMVGLDTTIAPVITTTWSPDKNIGSEVKVKVDYTFKPFVPGIPSTLHLIGTTAMVISY